MKTNCGWGFQMWMSKSYTKFVTAYQTLGAGLCQTDWLCLLNNHSFYCLQISPMSHCETINGNTSAKSLMGKNAVHWQLTCTDLFFFFFWKIRHAWTNGHFCQLMCLLMWNQITCASEWTQPLGTPRRRLCSATDQRDYWFSEWDLFPQAREDCKLSYREERML